MKKTVFKHRYGIADHEVDEIEVEFDDDATEEEINEEWRQWVWEKVSDSFTWYEK